MATITPWRRSHGAIERAPHQIRTQESAIPRDLLNAFIGIFELPASSLYTHLSNIPRWRTPCLTCEDALEVSHTHGYAPSKSWGIRIALGAGRGRVFRLILGQGLTVVCLGLTLGIAAALALTRVIRSLLFGVTASDPLTFMFVSLLLLTVALLACVVPARRATKVDPLIALRNE